MRSSIESIRVAKVTCLLVLLALVASNAIVGHKHQLEGSKFVFANDERLQAEGPGQEVDAGEQVDRMASPAGDTYWQGPQQQAQLDWCLQSLVKAQQRIARPEEQGEEQFQDEQIKSGRAEKRQPTNLYAYPQQYGPTYEANFDGPMRSYQALVNEYKHWSQLSNPSREGRAFKPKLMSTARGFGKRASKPRASYSGLLAAVDARGPISRDEKMGGSAMR